MISDFKRISAHTAGFKLQLELHTEGGYKESENDINTQSWRDKCR